MKTKLFEHKGRNSFKLIRESNLNELLTMDYYVELLSGEEVDVLVKFEFSPGEDPVGPDVRGKMPTSGADSKVTIRSVINKMTGQEINPEECEPGTQDRLIDAAYEYVNDSGKDPRF